MYSTCTCNKTTCIFKMFAKPIHVDGKILAIYQKRLIDLYSKKITIMVEGSTDQDPIIHAICNGVNATIKIEENMSLQKQTILLAIYNKYIVDNVKTVGDKILQIAGDYLVFCGLYNLQYDNSYFEAYYDTIINYIKNSPPQAILISKMNIMAAIYGLNKQYTAILCGTDWTTSNFTPFEKIISWVRGNETNICEIFTEARCQNHYHVQPRGFLQLRNMATENVLQYINGSNFINTVTNKINAYTMPFVIPDSKLVCINNRKGHYVKCFTDTASYISHIVMHRMRTLFAIAMSFEFETTTIFRNRVLVNDVFEAIKISKEYEHGIILMFPTENLPLNGDVELSADEFQNHTNTSMNIQNCKYITHKNGLNQTHYYIKDDDAINEFFKKSNLIGIICISSREHMKCFNQK